MTASIPPELQAELITHPWGDASSAEPSPVTPCVANMDQIAMKSSICRCQRPASPTRHMPRWVAPFTNSFLLSRSVPPSPGQRNSMASAKWPFSRWNWRIPPRGGALSVSLASCLHVELSKSVIPTSESLGQSSWRKWVTAQGWIRPKHANKQVNTSTWHEMPRWVYVSFSFEYWALWRSFGLKRAFKNVHNLGCWSSEIYINESSTILNLLKNIFTPALNERANS